MSWIFWTLISVIILAALYMLFIGYQVARMSDRERLLLECRRGARNPERGSVEVE